MYNTFLLVSAILCITADIVSGQAQCPDQADIVVVLDDSESLMNYDSSTDSFTNAAGYIVFLTALISGLDSANQQLALITFSTNTATVSSLSNQFTAAQVALATRTPEFAKQNTDLGIQAARTELANNGRVDASSQYIIVITDGNSFDTAATRDQILAATADNITLIAISMRNDFTEGYVIAGRRYREFTVSSPAELQSSAITLAASINEIICPVCKGFADVVYLLDGSDSTLRVSPDFTSTFYAPGIGWFVNNVTENVADSNVRTGIILYSQTAKIESNLTLDTAAVVDVVNNLQPEYANTMAGLAFGTAQQVFDDANPQLFADDRKIVVYLVDGTVTDTAALVVNSAILRSTGVQVFAVGFGSTATTIDLLLAVGAGNTDNIFRVNSDLELVSGNGVSVLTNFLCRTPVSLTAPLVDTTVSSTTSN